MTSSELVAKNASLGEMISTWPTPVSSVPGGFFGQPRLNAYVKFLEQSGLNERNPCGARARWIVEESNAPWPVPANRFP